MANLWEVIKPQAATNYVNNPSAEVGLTSWSTSGATLSRVAGGVYGAYAFRILASSSGGRAMYVVPANTTPLGATVGSCWVKATSSLVFIDVNDGAGGTTSFAHPGDGAWWRLEVTRPILSGNPYTFQVRDARPSAWTNVDFDGVCIEAGTAATTYIDGDQEGCVWVSAPHTSQSFRLAGDGRGGVLTQFEGLGLLVTGQVGIGVPDTEVGTQERTLSDGSSWTRSRAEDRIMDLSTLVIGNGTPASLHTTRRAILTAFAAGFGVDRGPVVLRYSGASEAKRITAHYEQGFGWDKIDGADEKAVLRFRSPDPFWYSETDSSVALDPNDTLTNIKNFLLQRRDATWTNMQQGVSTPNLGYPFEYKLSPDSYLYAWGSFQGSFTSVGSSNFVAKWDGINWIPANSVGNPNGTRVNILAFDPTTGGYVIGGTFTTVGGIARGSIASIDANGNLGTSYGGGANGEVTGLAFDHGGNLWTTGFFTTLGGGAATRAGYWNGSAWTALGPASTAYTQLQLGPDGNMYALDTTGVKIGGAFTAFATVAGGSAFDMQWRPEGLYLFGTFTSVAGVACAGAARYRGGSWEAIASSFTASSGTAKIQGKFGPDGVFHGYTNCSQIDGSILPSVSGQNVACRWDGSVWSVDYPFISSGGSIFGIWPQLDGSVAYSLNDSAAATAITPGLTTTINNGSAESYPVIVFDTGVGFIHSIVNLTTGRQLRFSGMLKYGNERIVLDLRVGRKTVTSTYRQLIGTVLPNSDLDTFSLAPGTNVIQVYADATITTASMFWRNRHWSAD